MNNFGGSIKKTMDVQMLKYTCFIKQSAVLVYIFFASCLQTNTHLLELCYNI